MHIAKLIAAAAFVATAAGCLDLPVDEWDGTARRRRQAPAPTMVAVPSGETNIYVREPVYYAGPIYTESTYVRRRYPANFNVYGTGTYRGVNYGVGYGGNAYGYGGYGTASGTSGNTQWNASWGYPTYAGGYGYGGSNPYGIYGNCNGGGSNSEPSRFSVYR
jgi:hypothetical protein